MNDKKSSPENKTSQANVDFLKIFNYLGSALIFFGIAFFISVNWSSLNDFIKIFSTLGAAIAAYIIGILLHLNEKHETASSAFFMLSGLVLPIGLYVTLNVFNLYSIANKTEIVISCLCFCLFLLSHLLSPRTIFLLFIILFGSIFFFNFSNFIADQSTFVYENIFEYQLISLGLSYLFLGRYLDFEKKYPLIGPLYFFGGLFILAGSYILGGLFCFDTGILFWKILTPILIFSSFLLSVKLKSKSLLCLGSLFLVIYITDMSIWFARTLGNMGWPLVLIIIGFGLMFIGYLIFNINKKITSNE